MFRRSFSSAFALLIMLGACGGGAATTTVTSPPATTASPATTAAAAEEDMGDVLEVAAAEGDLGTFLSALEAAGIMGNFHGEGPFTLFVPTDQAFLDYVGESGMTQEEIFAGQEMLTAILHNHIVEMEDDAEMVMGMAGQSFTTAGGQPLEVTVEGETVMIGAAEVLRYDLHASNGIIHVIDKVLIPES